MDLSQRFKKWLIKRQAANFYELNFSRLHKIIKDDLFLEKNQLVAWFDRFLQEPNPLYHPYIEIAQLYTNAAAHERASEFYLRFLDKNKDATVHALYLQNLLLSESATNSSLLSAHQDFAKNYDNKNDRLNWRHKFSRDTNKKLKIGYICHFFDNSISDSCLLPFLKLHDKQRFSVYCYDDGNTQPAYRQHADFWRDVRGISDEKLAKIIEDDGIDILQELNGFCLINRFGALRYRPAPIQINWYNHTSTTGLNFIDYVMSDKYSIFPDDLAYFVESAYLTDEFIAAKAVDLKEYGEVTNTTPKTQCGYITFGYFGSSHKITQQALRLWSSVLSSVPGSKLVLKSGSFSHPIFCKIFHKHFKAYGIDANRLEFRGWSDHKSTVAQYNDIDIMLDNAPVSGGSTLFEALTQSVPTITLQGNRWAARSGASVLKTLNHPELIAKQEDEYVKLATNLAQDTTRLNDYRKTLRNEMLQSKLSDIASFYKNFETAYLNMWQTWCKNSL